MIPLWLITAGMKALGLGKSFFGWLRSLSPQTLLILALCLASAFLWLRGNHVTKQRDRALAGLVEAKRGIENLRQASLKALDDAKANKVRVETQYVRIKDNAQTAISARLRSELDRVRAASESHQGGADATGVSGPADTASDPFGRDRTAVVHDAEICTTNTVKAEGWQDWYAQALVVPRTPETPQ